jgi:hypothetical protein
MYGPASTEDGRLYVDRGAGAKRKRGDAPHGLCGSVDHHQFSVETII